MCLFLLMLILSQLDNGCLKWLLARGLNTVMSKNAHSWEIFQNHEKYSKTSGNYFQSCMIIVLEIQWDNVLPENGWSCRTTCTFEQTWDKRSTVTSQSSFCQILGNHQSSNLGSVQSVKNFPQTHISITKFIPHNYTIKLMYILFSSQRSILSLQNWNKRFLS